MLSSCQLPGKAKLVAWCEMQRGYVEVLLFSSAAQEASHEDRQGLSLPSSSLASTIGRGRPRICDMHCRREWILTCDVRDGVMILDYSCSKRVVLESSLSDIYNKINNVCFIAPFDNRHDVTSMAKVAEEFSNQMVHNTLKHTPAATGYTPSSSSAVATSDTASCPYGNIKQICFADYATMKMAFKCKSSCADLDLSNHTSDSRILLLCTNAVVLFDYGAPADSIVISSAALNGTSPSSVAFIDPHALAIGCSDGAVHVMRIGRGIANSSTDGSDRQSMTSLRSNFTRLKSIGLHSKHEILCLKALPSHHSYRDSLVIDPADDDILPLYTFVDNSSSGCSTLIRQPARCLSIDSGGGIYIWDFHLAYRREAGRLFIVDLVGCKAPLARLAYDTSIFSSLKQKAIVFEGIYIDDALQTITITTSDRHARIWDISALDIFSAAAGTTRVRSETIDSKSSNSTTAKTATGGDSRGNIERSRNTRQAVDLSNTVDFPAVAQLKLGGSLRSKFSTTSASALVAPIPFYHTSFSVNGSIMGTYLLSAKNCRTIAIVQCINSLQGDDESDTGSLHSSITATNGHNGSSHMAVHRLMLVDEIDVADALVRVGVSETELPCYSSSLTADRLEPKRRLKYFFTSTSPHHPNVLVIGSSRGILVLGLHTTVAGPSAATHPLWKRQHLTFQSGALRQVLITGDGGDAVNSTWAPVMHEIVGEFDISKQPSSANNKAATNSTPTDSSSDDLLHRLCCLSQQCRPAVHSSPSGKFCAFVFPVTHVFIIVSVNAADDTVTASSTLHEVGRGRCTAFGWLAISPWQECFSIVPLLPDDAYEDDDATVTTTKTTTSGSNGSNGHSKTPKKSTGGKKHFVFKKAISLFGSAVVSDESDKYNPNRNPSPTQFCYINTTCMTVANGGSGGGCTYKIETVSSDVLDTTAISSSRLQQMLSGVLLGLTIAAPEDRSVSNEAAGLVSAGCYKKNATTQLMLIATAPTPAADPKPINRNTKRTAEATSIASKYTVQSVGPPLAAVSAISWSYTDGFAAVLIGRRINILYLQLELGSDPSAGSCSLRALSSVCCDVSPFSGYYSLIWSHAAESRRLIYHTKSAVMVMAVDALRGATKGSSALCGLNIGSLVVTLSRGTSPSDLGVTYHRSSRQHTLPIASGVCGSADVVEMVGADDEFVYVNAKKAANAYDNHIIAIKSG